MIRMYSDLGPKEIGKNFYQQMLQEHERNTAVSRPEVLNSDNTTNRAVSVACYETYWEEDYPNYRMGTGFYY